MTGEVTIDQLILKMLEVRAKSGNLPVRVYDGDMCFYAKVFDYEESTDNEDGVKIFSIGRTDEQNVDSKESAEKIAEYVRNGWQESGKASAVAGTYEEEIQKQRTAREWKEHKDKLVRQREAE